MLLNKKDITTIYNKINIRANKAYENGYYDKCLNYINISAFIAYTFVWKYCDDDLEILLNNLSSRLINTVKTYECIKNKRIVFYDYYTLDNKGVSQQYIRALISNNIEFLYITESSKSNKNSKDIFKELEAYDRVEVYEIPQNIKRTEQIQLIYHKIISYKSDKLLMHLSPSSVSALTAFYALPKEITKYQINITDHAFWLGNKCLDYSLEFRPRGCTLSKEKRGLKENQILLQPFYPIISESVFRGFPEECANDKVVIFSGGALYKIYGDNGEFFNLVKQILDDNPNVVFLFAGIGDSFTINKFIKTNNFDNRFILLGHRSDINEVFKNCDIYMGTYPIGGGLMSQYAAINEKPILNYMTNRAGNAVEEFVCQNSKCEITFTEKGKFFIEAKRLINDVNYRIQRGKEIKSCLITKEQFDESLLQTIISNENIYDYQDVKIEDKNVFDHYLEIENKYQNNFKLFFVRRLRTQAILLSPKIFIWFVLFVFSNRGFSKIRNYFSIRFSRN